MSKDMAGVRYWKISPWGNRWSRKGHGRIWEDQWEECLNQDKIWIGWAKIGNLSDVPLEEAPGIREIKKRLHRAYSDYKPQGLGKVAWQIWRFRTIQPGDVVVANKGQSEIAGIGIVTRGYSYDERNEFPHGLKIDWRDTNRKEIKKQNHWLLTVQELDTKELRRIGAYSQGSLNRLIRLAGGKHDQHQATDRRQRQKIKEENLRRVARTSAKVDNNDEDFKNLRLDDVPDESMLSHKKVRALVSHAQRNARIAKELKRHYNGRCQICRRTFRKKDGENYAEVHHLKANDHPKNLVVLCATCHRMLHYADVQIERTHEKRLQRVIINETPRRIRYSSEHAKFFQNGKEH